MISNLVSFFISVRLQKEPIYDALARQDGIHLPSAAARGQLGGPRVAQVMRQATEILPPVMTVKEALERVGQRESRSWLVGNERGLLGVMTTATLGQTRAEGGADRRLEQIIDARVFPHVHADQSLHLALERMGAAGQDLLPVVSRADPRLLEGVVFLRDVLAAYGVDEEYFRRQQEL